VRPLAQVRLLVQVLVLVLVALLAQARRAPASAWAPA
jgi:hypothetical protein